MWIVALSYNAIADFQNNVQVYNGIFFVKYVFPIHIQLEASILSFLTYFS